nr:hypothetical protein [uncultured Devosia sp.]
MKHVTIQEAQAQLETLLASGETVEILRDGKVLGQLLPAPADSDQTGGKIDLTELKRFRATLTSPMVDTDEELRDWKDEARY